MTISKRRVLAAFAATTIVVLLAACESGGDNKADSNRESEQQSIANGFERVIASQQVPTFDYSQERQTLIDAMTIRHSWQERAGVGDGGAR